MNWENYLNNRLIKKCQGFYVIKPANLSVDTYVPLACPICDYLMRTTNDEKSYKVFSCCENCELNWARPNQKRWQEGWRPLKEDVKNKVGEKKLNVEIEI